MNNSNNNIEKLILNDRYLIINDEITNINNILQKKYLDGEKSFFDYLENIPNNNQNIIKIHDNLYLIIFKKDKYGTNFKVIYPDSNKENIFLEPLLE